jgi:hypothetical protein
MAAPIRSQVEIDVIINKANHSIADLGTEILGLGKLGKQFTDVDFRDLGYRIILLRAYLKNVLDPVTGELKLYYTASANEKKLNVLLTAIAELSNKFSGPGIPLIRGRRLPLYYYPSSNSLSSGSNSNSGGPATPGGVTFQNINVETPGEVVDSLDATSSEFAYYIISVRGTNSGEGSRLDIIGVMWRDSEAPVITEYRGGDVGGTTAGVTFSAALNGASIELTCNVPTDGWIIRGTRISYLNISFENAQGPLPTGGTVGQYLRKLNSTNYDAAFADIIISEITGLVTALTNLQTNIDNEAATRSADDLLRLLLTGGTMSGAIAMDNNKITGLAEATSNGDALRYEQLIGLYLLLTGGTMSGPIAMGGSKITGLAAATANGDAVRYEQLPFDIEIGDWNIYVSGGGSGSSIKNFAHGQSDFKKIRILGITIRNDADDSYFYTPLTGTAGNFVQGSLIYLTSNLDFPGFANDSGYNRGWVTIQIAP